METSSPTLKKRNNDSPTEYLHEDSVILDTSQNITFNNDNHHLQLVPDSPLRKKRHKKSLSSDGYDDSDHNQSLSNSHSDISAIQSIDALSHSAQGSHLADLNLHQPTNGITVATMPYIATMPVMYNPTAYDYNMLLRSNDALNSSGGSSEHQTANGAAIASVQFGLPWITGGYPSIPLAVDAEQYQHLIMQQQHQMRPYDARTIQSRDPNINESPHSDSEQMKRSGNMLPNTVSFLSGGRFFLVEQPNVRQRKSYKNENRYILPNPLTVCAREESPDEKLPKIIEGTVSVKLVNSDAAELPSTKQNVLVSPDGSLCLNLDRNNSAHFSLKVLETSEGTMFRLLFNVNFSLEGVGPVEERILSRPFQVYSNRKKNSKAERPIVLDMKPSDGPTSTESEVWIKGRGFTDKVVVLFGDKVGRVTESSENLITVFAPSRYDLPANTTVTVTVSNRTQQDILSADKQLSFTYFVG